jgi:hypothetical protein
MKHLFAVFMVAILLVFPSSIAVDARSTYHGVQTTSIFMALTLKGDYDANLVRWFSSEVERVLWVGGRMNVEAKVIDRSDRQTVIVVKHKDSNSYGER